MFHDIVWAMLYRSKQDEFMLCASTAAMRRGLAATRRMHATFSVSMCHTWHGGGVGSTTPAASSQCQLPVSGSLGNDNEFAVSPLVTTPTPPPRPSS